MPFLAVRLLGGRLMHHQLIGGYFDADFSFPAQR